MRIAAYALVAILLLLIVRVAIDGDDISDDAYFIGNLLMAILAAILWTGKTDR